MVLGGGGTKILVVFSYPQEYFVHLVYTYPGAIAN